MQFGWRAHRCLGVLKALVGLAKVFSAKYQCVKCRCNIFAIFNISFDSQIDLSYIRMQCPVELYPSVTPRVH